MRLRKPVHHHRLSLLGWVYPVAARCGFRPIVVAGANGRVVGGHATRRVGWHKAVHVVAGDTEEPLRIGRTMTYDASIAFDVDSSSVPVWAADYVVGRIRSCHLGDDRLTRVAREPRTIDPRVVYERVRLMAV